MEGWIEQHATLLQVVVSLATVVIWIFYAQLLFLNYRRIRRPKIVINQMLGRSDKARFMISNMSQEAIHIDKVLVCMGSGEDRVCQQVTDADPDQEDTRDDAKSMLSANLNEVTVQGPLGAGKCIELGAFQNLLNRIGRQHNRKSDRENQDDSQNRLPNCDVTGGDADCRVEIIVIAVYSSEKGVIGASRTFVCQEDGELRPENVQTTQHAGFFARRRMARLHAEYV